MKVVPFITSLLQKRNGGTERLSNFPKDTQQSQVRSSEASSFQTSHMESMA